MSFPLAASASMSASPWASVVSPTQLGDSSGSIWSSAQAMAHLNKRPLESYLAAPDLMSTPIGTSHVIPSGEPTQLCATERDMLHTSHKRMRYNDTTSLGQGECSVDPLLGNCPSMQESCADTDFASCISDHSLTKVSLHEQQQQPQSQHADSMVWWKQRQPRHQPSTEGTRCYVCQNPATHTNAIDQETPQQTTLLSFFSPTLTAPKVARHAMDSTAHERGFSSPTCHRASVAMASTPSSTIVCAHCERSDLCSNCVRSCEECLATFCVFCSMLDAGSCVCLDCASSNSMRSFNDDEDMQIDL